MTKSTGRRAAKQTLAFDQFIAQLATADITLLEIYWKGVSKPYRVQCTNEHEFYVRPNIVKYGVRGSFCQACYEDKRFALDIFKRKFEARGGVVRSNRLHLVLCPNGHKTDIHPSTVIEHYWDHKPERYCKECRQLTQNAKLEEFRSCPKPTTRPWREPKIMQGHWLYVVYDPSINEVKFGITSKDIKARDSRLAHHKTAGYTKVLRLIETPHARDIETEIIDQLSKAKFKPVYGFEYFDSATLSLIIEIIDSRT